MLLQFMIHGASVIRFNRYSLGLKDGFRENKGKLNKNYSNFFIGDFDFMFL